MQRQSKKETTNGNARLLKFPGLQSRPLMRTTPTYRGASFECGLVAQATLGFSVLRRSYPKNRGG
jgi:hypothetical protein